MPFKSEAQRKFLFAKNPALAKKFSKDKPEDSKDKPDSAAQHAALAKARKKGKK